jgi:putative addiction module CopG family antidote
VARASSINILLTPKQARLIRQQVNSGHFHSPSDVVRKGLDLLFRQPNPRKSNLTALKDQLEHGYRATSKRDRKIANEWATLAEAWPEE